MKAVYIAAPWSHKPEAEAASKLFEEAGFTVTSHWIQYHTNAWGGYNAGEVAPDTDNSELQLQAREDLLDIALAECFVILNLDKSEGKATELGWAIAGSKEIVLVGEKSRNLFYHLPQVRQVGSVEEAIQVLR